MSGQFLCGPTLTVLLAAACGCGTDRAQALAPDPDVVRAVAAAGAGKEAEDIARAQKPDDQAKPAGPPVKLLDQPPDRPAGVANVPPVARIIATINSEAILEEEVRAATYTALLNVRRLPEPERTQKTNEIINAALTQLVEREVVMQDLHAKFGDKGPAAKQGAKIIEKLKEGAEKEFERQVLKTMRDSGGFKTEQDFKDYFHSQGMSLEMVRRQWQRSFIAMEYLRNRAITAIDAGTGHLALVEYYEKHPEEFKVDDNVVWQDLFVNAARHPTREDARAHAEALAERIRKGEDFVTLAKQYDNGDSSLRKDSEGIGYRFNEIRPPEAAAVLFRLHDGEVGPLVELATGFHIVRVVRREIAGQLPFDEKVQKQIKEKLRNEIGQREIKRLVNEMKRNAIIEYANGAK